MAGVVDAYSDMNAYRIPCNLSDTRQMSPFRVPPEHLHGQMRRLFSAFRKKIH
jgi:hypothetical protein